MIPKELRPAIYREAAKSSNLKYNGTYHTIPAILTLFGGEYETKELIDALPELALFEYDETAHENQFRGFEGCIELRDIRTLALLFCEQISAQP